jgi:twitching motility two-component system response regulator PilG
MAKFKIMVVEDDEKLLELECILLTSSGYRVCGMLRGKEALESIEKEMPDLILLDVMLPDVDGFEVCRQIKSNPMTNHIPVVLLTAKKGIEDMVKGEEVKADHYLTKPFKSAVVLETIRTFLNR